MMTQEMINEVTEGLQRWVGKESRVWMYSQSLEQLHIQLGDDHDGNGFADLRCYGCWRIEMPMAWKTNNIFIEKLPDEKIVVSDKLEKVRVVCDLVSIIEGVHEPVV